MVVDNENSNYNTFEHIHRHCFAKQYFIYKHYVTAYCSATLVVNAVSMNDICTTLCCT